MKAKKQAYVEIKVALDKAADELRTNFSVNMQIVTAQVDQAKVVQFEAINQRANGEEYVIVKQADGKTKEITVKTGITNDIFMEIISDQINIGDEIQIQPNDSIQEDKDMFGLF